MKVTKLIIDKNQFNSQKVCKDLYKGACVKIKNSQKLFQVIGINKGAFSKRMKLLIRPQTKNLILSLRE